MVETDNRTEANQYQERIIDLKVDGHLMSLASGLYCIYHAPDQVPADHFGFPGLRISLPPFKQDAQIDIETFEKDGWLGADKNAVLVRVSEGMGLILVTVYRNPAHNHPPPKLQVVRLNDAPGNELMARNAEENIKVNEVKAGMDEHAMAEKIQQQSHHAARQQQTASAQEAAMRVVAHVQRMGDVSVNMNDWIGIPDSKTWIEGFGIALDDRLNPEDIEYQAVLGKGWLSPWYKGNQYCGSRGMALPLCGLRVRLSEAAAKKYVFRTEATFIDGTKLGPIDDDTTLSSESVSPLEAVRFQLIEKTAEKEQVTKAASADKGNKTAPAARSNIKMKNNAAKEAILKAVKEKTSLKKTQGNRKA